MSFTTILTTTLVVCVKVIGLFTDNTRKIKFRDSVASLDQHCLGNGRSIHKTRLG